MKKFRLVLLPFSWIYSLITFLRNKLYDAGILPSVSFPRPVICIGNLNTGGTGKTPHTEYLISLLEPEKKTAVLSRGYGRTSKGFMEVAVNSAAAMVGDESLQIKKKFSTNTVCVCESRVEGVKSIMKKYPETEVILLDDAFQHRNIKAGFNILLTSFNDLYCNDHVLPAGNLREPVSGAGRAQAIIVTKSPLTISHVEKNKTLAKLNAETGQEVFFTSLHYSELKHLLHATTLSLSDLQTVEIVLVTGLASGEQVNEFLSSKSRHVHHLEFGDHHAYCSKDLALIRDKFNTLAHPNKIIVVTEKDAVKLSDEKLSSFLRDLPVFYLPVAVLFDPDEEKLFKKLIYEYVGKN